MDRRQFLATGATLAATITGGCTGCATSPPLTFSMEETSNGDIAHRLTESLNRWDDNHQIAINATENESVTATGVEEPFPSGTPYIYGGAVYVAETTIVDQTPGTEFVYSIDPVAGEETIDTNTISFEDLPEVDKFVLAERDLGSPDPTLGFTTRVHYRNEDVDDSVLVPEPEYEMIEWPETKGRIEIDSRVDRPLKTYAYTAVVVAESVQQYGQEVRQLVEFELGPLDDAAAAVVDEATENSPYTVPPEEELSAAESRVVAQYEDEEQVRRLNESARDTATATGTYIVRYRDRVYWTEIYGTID